MRRKVFLLTVLSTICVSGLVTAGLKTNASSNAIAIKDRGFTDKIQEPVTVTVTPLAPSQAQVDSAIRAIRSNQAFSKYFQGSRNRLLSVEYLDTLRTSPPQYRIRATFYNYGLNLPIIVESAIGDTSRAIVTFGKTQPLPSPEEFNAAVNILKYHPDYSDFFNAGKAATYQTMPPLASESVASERTLNVGLEIQGHSTPNRIVAVNLVRETVATYPKNAPPTAQAIEVACGDPSALQGTTARGTAGQYDLTISAGGSPLWKMLVIRPSASSGTRASGVELRDVHYLGKLVLKRAHVPILNVKYDDNACGPYRDWQWQEGAFTADGTDVAPGVRVCSSPPQTVIESHNDMGNFRGVAIYQNPLNNEVSIVSELEASWYRYISRWEFSPTGLIRARFGFDGVNNSCICNAHNHHAYWRFDFDTASAGRNRFTEYDSRSFFTPLLTETKRYRDYIRGRYWTVENLVTGELLTIQPGHDDGVADAYARGDAWFLRYRSTELDDGHNSTGSNTEADLDQFVNGESIYEQDVVMWYGAHFYHAFGGADGGHLVGPDIIVTRW